MKKRLIAVAAAALFAAIALIGMSSSNSMAGEDQQRAARGTDWESRGTDWESRGTDWESRGTDWE